MSQNPNTQNNVPPGWNDPPILGYNHQTSNKPKLNLNKRIAFPIQSGTAKPTAIVQPTSANLPNPGAATGIPVVPPTALSSQSPPIAVVPPMHINPPPLMRVPPLCSRNETPTASIQRDDLATLGEDQVRLYCLNTFVTFSSRLSDSGSIRSDEIQKRINLMNQLWLSGTLNSSVHRKLLRIAKALEANDFNEALESHRALVVDHHNVCSTWAAALRQLILTIQDSARSDEMQHSMQSFNNILVPTENVGDNSTSADGESQSESTIRSIQEI